MPRRTTPESRHRCAVHAASELLAWHHPGTPGWTPSLRQIVNETNSLYSWVQIDEVEAQAALDEVLQRRSNTTATAAA